MVKIGNKLYGIPAVHAGDMPTDLQQQTGRRFEELIFELNGEVRGGGPQHDDDDSRSHLLHLAWQPACLTASLRLWCCACLPACYL